MGVLRDTARAPQPPTNRAQNDQRCQFGAKFGRFWAKILIFSGESKQVLVPT